ncbi:unnamed protein product [Darwinula stevensoni]|uniref:Uncharacterized protein n=1 Tax=Darwinula stevensoni TaxID=69355 RepID=A0A7R8X251_9CRUS|nr:unnamed protein product [Darwinula stevensoni]CAG0883502.1 unnamed protein product [Darwinula stevensoni]
MGISASKRSVDITKSPDKKLKDVKDVKDVKEDKENESPEVNEVEKEKEEDAENEKPMTNGEAHSSPEGKTGKEKEDNDKDKEKEKEKDKDKKVKKKRSFRSFSFLKRKEKSKENGQVEKQERGWKADRGTLYQAQALSGVDGWGMGKIRLRDLCLESPGD